MRTHDLTPKGGLVGDFSSLRQIQVYSVWRGRIRCFGLLGYLLSSTQSCCNPKVGFYLQTELISYYLGDIFVFSEWCSNDLLQQNIMEASFVFVKNRSTQEMKKNPKLVEEVGVFSAGRSGEKRSWETQTAFLKVWWNLILLYQSLSYLIYEMVPILFFFLTQHMSVDTNVGR